MPHGKQPAGYQLVLGIAHEGFLESFHYSKERLDGNVRCSFVIKFTHFQADQAHANGCVNHMSPLEYILPPSVARMQPSAPTMQWTRLEQQ